METKIDISVLMCVYNGELFIREAIESVLGQTFRNFEFIIVNDGSNDDTEKIIKDYDDERIKLVNTAHAGIASALNAGLLHCRAAFIARFDADDICYAHRLETQYRFFQKNPDYIIVGSAADYINQEGEYVFTAHPSHAPNVDILKKKSICPFIHSSVMYKKDAVLEFEYEPQAHSFEDHLLWIQLMKKGPGANIQQPLMQVRLNPGSITIDDKWRTRHFHSIKNKVLREGKINIDQGNALKEILKKQDNRRIREGAYHSLLAKKFLWDNYQPDEARKNLRKVITLNKTDWKSYFFFLLSFLPERVLQKWYRRVKQDNRIFMKQIT